MLAGARPATRALAAEPEHEEPLARARPPRLTHARCTMRGTAPHPHFRLSRLHVRTLTRLPNPMRTIGSSLRSANMYKKKRQYTESLNVLIQI